MKRPEFDESRQEDKEYLNDYYSRMADYWDTKPNGKKVAERFRKINKSYK